MANKTRSKQAASASRVLSSSKGSGQTTVIRRVGASKTRSKSAPKGRAKNPPSVPLKRRPFAGRAKMGGFKVQRSNGDSWVAIATFQKRLDAITYAQALHRINPGWKIRVYK